MQGEFQQITEENEMLDIKSLLERYLRHWKWFAFSIFVIVSIAFVYLRYTQAIYKSSAKLLIEDDKKTGTGSSDLAVFKDLGLFAGGSNTQNEIEILKSRRLAQKVVDQLNLNILYIDKSSRTGLKSVELYKTSPLSVVLHDTTEINQRVTLHLKRKSEESFSMSYQIGANNNSEEKELKFSDKFTVGNRTYSIEKTDDKFPCIGLVH